MIIPLNSLGFKLGKSSPGIFNRFMFRTVDEERSLKPFLDSPSCFIDANGQLLGICLQNRGPIGCLPKVDRMSHGVSFPTNQPGRRANALCEAGFHRRRRGDEK
jgi:hypothetical protein